mmetsp:Transcript_12750/g.51284  ORF Transcript_12750/g.51284 Transcript_12750/m.51284 type:complete len:90 (+) Transcript_12750:25-294(+)
MQSLFRTSVINHGTGTSSSALGSTTAAIGREGRLCGNIEIEKGPPAPAQRPYPMLLVHRERLQAELEELEQQGFISRSRKPYASTCLLR